MHTQAAMTAEDRLGDDRLEHRADDQLRPVAGRRRLHRAREGDDCDGDLMTELGECDLDALAEAVVRQEEQQHPQAAVRDLERLSGRLVGESNHRDLRSQLAYGERLTMGSSYGGPARSEIAETSTLGLAG
jgi:hypothetical protein